MVVGWEVPMFRDREDAGRKLAKKLKGRSLHDPLVLAIPRGGVVTGARMTGTSLQRLLPGSVRHSIVAFARNSS
jgi:hypoxanthine phosphoribosyltransferase